MTTREGFRPTGPQYESPGNHTNEGPGEVAIDASDLAAFGKWSAVRLQRSPRAPDVLRSGRIMATPRWPDSDGAAFARSGTDESCAVRHLNAKRPARWNPLPPPTHMWRRSVGRPSRKVLAPASWQLTSNPRLSGRFSMPHGGSVCHA